MAFTAALSLFMFAAGERAAIAQDQPAAGRGRQAALTSLVSELHVGAEFFLNRSETRESVEKHFRLMHENGLTLVRIFIIWDDLERTPGAWNFESYDWIYPMRPPKTTSRSPQPCAPKTHPAG